MAKAIVITGTPSVGKTTLARRLARELDLQLVDVGELVKRKGLHTGYDITTAAYVIDERRLRSMLRKTLGTESVLATNYLGGIIESGSASLVLVLRLDPAALYARLRGKGYALRKAWENVEAELLDVCYFDAVKLLGRRRVFEIDTTGKSKSRVMKEALRIVQRKSKGSRRRVDWLRVYDPILLGRRLRVGKAILDC